MEDNLAQQIDELEVLISIFGDQWKKCNKMNDTYSISIAKDVELWITLNDAYPSDKPPQYDLWAPNLSRSQKDCIDSEFKEIYETNKGFPIIFQWIEKVKEVNNSDVITTNDEINSENGNEVESDNLETTLCKVNGDKSPKEYLNIIHGPTITDRKSTFQGHVCKVTDPSHIGQFMEQLQEHKKVQQATHNILAYRIVTENNTLLQDCEDDGETHAGGRLLHLLEILDLKNVAVVVSRWYGGIHLGPDRFKHINNAARQTLVEAGFIK